MYRLLSFFLVFGLGACATAATPPDVVSTRSPATADVVELDMSDWEDEFCAGSTEMILDVAPGSWVEVPVGWIATDEATARENWESMSFTVWLDGEPMEIGGPLQWEQEEVRIECPNTTIEGSMVAPLLYVEAPATGERTLRIRYLFHDVVHDGWQEYPAGFEGVEQQLVIRTR